MHDSRSRGENSRDGKTLCKNKPYMFALHNISMIDDYTYSLFYS